MPAHALAELSELHLKSSADLMHTIRLIAPQAFSSDTAVPDLSMLGAVHSSLMGLLSNVTDLQVFHMRRAVAINAEIRARISAKQRLQQQASMHGSFSNSSCSDNSQSLQQLQQLLSQRQQSPQPLRQQQQQQAPQLELQLSIDQQVLQLQGVVTQAPRRDQQPRAQDQAAPLSISCLKQPQKESPSLTLQLRNPSPTAQPELSMQLAQASSFEGHMQARVQLVDTAQHQQHAQHAQVQSEAPRQLPSEQAELTSHSVTTFEASRPETQLEHDQGLCMPQAQPKPKQHLAAQLQQVKEQVELQQQQSSPRAQLTAQVQQSQVQVQLAHPQGQIRQRHLQVNLTPQIQFEAHLEALQGQLHQMGLQAQQSVPQVSGLRQKSRERLLRQLEQKLQGSQQPQQQRLQQQQQPVL
jgi:PAX-interacting protein 1